MMYIARAISTIPKNSAKNTKATSANSTAATPFCFVRLGAILKNRSMARIAHRDVGRQQQAVLAEEGI
ncbi:hypothetical protein, partial [uncultured Massilia sp.]|uniref:hypothetical protein n=1 Tax=uncultured Massilia sp. TaxID=169973 RepID=UPI00258D37A0